MIAYVDGKYVPLNERAISIEDRGYQFADGVYEVCALVGGKVVDEGAHWARLARSLKALDMQLPSTRRAAQSIVREVIRRNGLDDGMIYIQVTRGAAAREHAAGQTLRPILVVTLRPLNRAKIALQQKQGIHVITQPDERWARCDIKAIALLPNVLARNAAKKRRAHEAWLVNADGIVTEGAASTAWIVDASGCVRTHPATSQLLAGITRARLLERLRRSHRRIKEKGFTLAEIKTAKEAFTTASVGSVLPVVSVDGRRIGDGKPGELGLELQNFDRKSD